jgi:hypothetical protein
MVSFLTTLLPLFTQTLRWERAHLCNVDGHLLPQPPFLSREGPSVQRGPAPLSTLSCDVSMPGCATWAGNSSRPSLPSSSRPLTHPEDGSSVGGIDSPPDPRRAVYPCLASCDVRRALRPATRTTTYAAPCVPLLAFPPAPHDLRHAMRPAAPAPPGVPHCALSVIFIPRDSFIISKNRANSCKH